MRRLLPVFLLLVGACDAGASGDGDGGDSTPGITFDDPVGVVSVLDGDTVLVARGGDTFKVRLRGVDAPELYADSDLPPEAFAVDARTFALNHAGLEVGLEYDADCVPDPLPVCLDPYDRQLAYIRLSNGDDLGEALLREGLARLMVFNDQPFDRLDAYVEALADAQKSGLAIWSK